MVGNDASVVQVSFQADELRGESLHLVRIPSENRLLLSISRQAAISRTASPEGVVRRCPILRGLFNPRNTHNVLHRFHLSCTPQFEEYRGTPLNRGELWRGKIREIFSIPWKSVSLTVSRAPLTETRLQFGAREYGRDTGRVPVHVEKFSRTIQSERAREVAASALDDALCPKRGRKCRVDTQTRQVTSIDGPIDYGWPCLDVRRSHKTKTPQVSGR